MDSITIGRTILQQLGGAGRLGVMLGVKQVCYTIHEGRCGIYFRFKARSIGNWIRVTLDEARDTYVVELWRFRGAKTKQIATLDDVYADNLIPVCEKMTGLAFRL